MMTRKWTVAETSNLLVEYRSGTPLKQVAEMMGRTFEAVRRQLLTLRRQGGLAPLRRFQPSDELKLELLRRWNRGEKTRNILEWLRDQGYDVKIGCWQSWLGRARMGGVPFRSRRDWGLTVPSVNRNGKDATIILGESTRLDLAEHLNYQMTTMERTVLADKAFAKALRGRRFASLKIVPRPFVNILPPPSGVARTATAWET